MEQVAPRGGSLWRAGPTARMDLLSLKAKQSRRKVELMERAGLSESEADGVAAKTVAGEAGEGAAAAVAAATAALGDGGDASNKTLQDASNDAGGGVPAAPKIVADAQAPAHPILASAAVAQISAALASATAKPSGGGGDGAFDGGGTHRGRREGRCSTSRAQIVGQNPTPDGKPRRRARRCSRRRRVPNSAGAAAPPPGGGGGGCPGPPGQGRGANLGVNLEEPWAWLR